MVHTWGFTHKDGNYVIVDMRKKTWLIYSVFAAVIIAPIVNFGIRSLTTGISSEFLIENAILYIFIIVLGSHSIASYYQRSVTLSFTPQILILKNETFKYLSTQDRHVFKALISSHMDPQVLESDDMYDFALSLTVIAAWYEQNKMNPRNFISLIVNNYDRETLAPTADMARKYACLQLEWESGRGFSPTDENSSKSLKLCAISTKFLV